MQSKMQKMSICCAHGLHPVSLPDSALLDTHKNNSIARQTTLSKDPIDESTPDESTSGQGITTKSALDEASFEDQAAALSLPEGFGKKPTEALEKLLKKHSGTQQLVLLQDFPDPDALSSAWAYRLIASAYNIRCDIYYSGTLSHQENVALVKLTQLPAKRWPANAKDIPDLKQYQGYVLIDTQGTTSHLTAKVQAAQLPLLLVIDHHASQGKLNAELIDIRPNIHATATIMAQYLQAGMIQLDRANSNHVKCATALMHGLRSDTNQLMQASEPDF